MCCPANVTEDFYLQHPAAYASHPPCFLAQLRSYDVNTDLCATRKYYNTLRLHGVHAELQLVPKADEHCYCLGTPAEPAASFSNYSSWCAKVGDEVYPDPGPMGLNCDELDACMREVQAQHESGLAKRLAVQAEPERAVLLYSKFSLNSMIQGKIFVLY